MCGFLPKPVVTSHAVRHVLERLACMTNTETLEGILSKRINVFVVDDNIDVLKYLADLLCSPLVNVITATSYEKACRAIHGFAGCWHTWIVDIDLGAGKTGLDIIREHPEFPFVLVLSGLGSMSLASEAVLLGAMKVFDKIRSRYETLVEGVIDVSSLGFILKGKQTKNLHMFSLLKDPLITSTKQWAEKAKITTRQLARICENHGCVTPSQYLALYNSCKYLLTCSLREPGEDPAEKAFASECVDAVLFQDGELLQEFLGKPGVGKDGEPARQC